MENEYDEIELLYRLKEGDRSAYLKIYDKYHSSLYSYALQFVKVPELAEDILQDVFIKIWEIRGRIDPSLAFNSYLYRICRNKVFKLIKKIARDKELQSQVKYQLINTIEDYDLKLQWKEYEHILHAAINHLPPQRQKVFKLCRQYGKKHEEVAAELGISRNTVKEHMTLSIKFIKQYFYQHADIQLSIVLLAAMDTLL